MDRPYVPVQVYTDLVAPYEGYHDQQHELFDALEIGEMCFFDIEPAGLHRFEALMQSFA